MIHTFYLNKVYFSHCGVDTPGEDELNALNMGGRRLLLKLGESWSEIQFTDVEIGSETNITARIADVTSFIHSVCELLKALDAALGRRSERPASERDRDSWSELQYECQHDIDLLEECLDVLKQRRQTQVG